jgi:ribonucleoside-triphosphate reductase
VAITCVKPSGTVSQLVDSASGIHTRHSPYYIRRIRMDKKDPIYEFLKDKGVQVEDEKFHPENTAVFSFPIKAPEGAVCRDNKNSLEQLDIWLLYQRHWCEHKPSVTISVKDEEWPQVGAWVWEHFDEVSGISFLPHSNHTYQQAPYEEITEEQYEALLAITPKEIDWSSFVEEQDNTEGTQTLACTAGACEI